MGIHKLPINPFRSKTDFCIVAIDFESCTKENEDYIRHRSDFYCICFLKFSFSKQSLGYYPLKNLTFFRMKIWNGFALFGQ